MIGIKSKLKIEDQLRLLIQDKKLKESYVIEEYEHALQALNESQVILLRT